MLRKKLLTLSLLSLAACGPTMPPEPAVWQCGYSWKYKKFSCVNTETKQQINRSLEDPVMEGAQALSLRDYQKAERYVKVDVKKWAEENCK